MEVPIFPASCQMETALAHSHFLGMCHNTPPPSSVHSGRLLSSRLIGTHLSDFLAFHQWRKFCFEKVHVMKSEKNLPILRSTDSDFICTCTIPSQQALDWCEIEWLGRAMCTPGAASLGNILGFCLPQTELRVARRCDIDTENIFCNHFLKSKFDFCLMI